MPDRWYDDVHGGLRVRLEVDGTARWSGEDGADADTVQDDVLALIAALQARADALEAWMRTWSEQEDTS